MAKQSAKRLGSGEYEYRGFNVQRLESGFWSYSNQEDHTDSDVVEGGFEVAKCTVDYLLESRK